MAVALAMVGRPIPNPNPFPTCLPLGVDGHGHRAFELGADARTAIDVYNHQGERVILRHDVILRGILRVILRDEVILKSYNRR